MANFPQDEYAAVPEAAGSFLPDQESVLIKEDTAPIEPESVPKRSGGSWRICCRRSATKTRAVELPTDPAFMPDGGEGEALMSTYTGTTAGLTTTKIMSLEEYEEYKKNSGATFTGTTAGPTYTGATYTGTTAGPTTMEATYTGATAGSTTTKTMSLEEYEEYKKNSGATYTGTTAGPTYTGATYTGTTAGPTTTSTRVMSLEEYEEEQKKKGAIYTGTTSAPTTEADVTVNHSWPKNFGIAWRQGPTKVQPSPADQGTDEPAKATAAPPTDQGTGAPAKATAASRLAKAFGQEDEMPVKNENAVDEIRPGAPMVGA